MGIRWYLKKLSQVIVKRVEHSALVANDNIRVLSLPWIHVRCCRQNPTSSVAKVVPSTTGATQQVGPSSPNKKTRHSSNNYGQSPHGRVGKVPTQSHRILLELWSNPNLAYCWAWEVATEVDLCSLARSPFHPLSSAFSHPSPGTKATTTNYNDTFEKEKVAIARANASPAAIVLPLVNVVMRDSHDTSIARKQKGKEIVSICLRVSKPTKKSSSQQSKYVVKMTVASKFNSTSYPEPSQNGLSVDHPVDQPTVRFLTIGVVDRSVDRPPPRPSLSIDRPVDMAKTRELPLWVGRAPGRPGPTTRLTTKACARRSTGGSTVSSPKSGL